MQRKAQWFIVGAITLITMMVVVTLGKSQVQIGQNIEPWQKYIFDNLRSESLSAINVMVRENATSKNIEERSKDYLDFLRRFGDSHGIEISSYFIIGLPAGNDINLSIVNFEQNELQNIAITINGTTQTIPSLADRNSATITFSSVPDYFTVNYTLTEENSTGGQYPESGTFSTARKVFSAVKLQVKSKDGNQIWQKTEWS